MEAEQVAKAVEELLAPRLGRLEEALSQPVKGYFTLAEAAAFVGCSTAHLTRHVKAFTLPASNIGTVDGPDYRIARSDLLAWMERRKVGAGQPPRPQKPAPLPLIHDPVDAAHF